MVRLSDLETELPRQLAQLLASGGTGNFLIVSAGPIYLQFAASPSDARIHIEAVSSRFLPPELQLGAAAHLRFAASGFELHDNYECQAHASGDEDLVLMAREAVSILAEVYGLAPDAELEIQCELEDIEHPSNEPLTLAMEAVRRASSPEVARDLSRELLRAVLLVPVDENGDPMATVDAGGQPLPLAFTDYPSLVASKADCGYAPVPGPELFAWTLEQGAPGLVVSAGGNASIQLSRANLEDLLAALPD